VIQTVKEGKHRTKLNRGVQSVGIIYYNYLNICVAPLYSYKQHENEVNNGKYVQMYTDTSM